MKRSIIAISSVIFMFASICTMTAKTHNYPMRVQVIKVHWHSRRGWYQGFGHANLIAQQPGKPPKQAMDFSFGCSHPVRHTFAPDTYPARYGKNQYQMVVLLPVLGTDKGSECTMKIEMKDFIYQGGQGGTLRSLPLQQMSGTPLQKESTNPD